MYHSLGFANLYVFTMLEGGVATVLERFPAEGFLDVVEQFKPEFTNLVPTMMLRIGAILSPIICPRGFRAYSPRPITTSIPFSRASA